MRILSKESFSVVQPLMSENYANLYSRLSLKLSPELARCFARYTMLPAHNAGQWSIDCEGEDDFRPFSQATPIQRMLASDKLNTLTEAITRSGVVPEPKKLLSVPDDSNIFFRQLPDGDIDIVFTQWGHRKIGSNSSIGNVSLIIGENNDLERTDVNLRIHWSDETPIASTPFKIELYGSSYERTTDQEGIIHLGSVASGEKIAVELDGYAPIKLHVDNNSQEYKVTIHLFVDATITCIDSSDKPTQATININGIPYSSNPEGVCELKDILIEPDTKLHVDHEGFGATDFKLNHDSSLNKFLFKIPTPPPVGDDGDALPPPVTEMPLTDISNNLDVRIRIIDKKNRPISFATILVTLQKGPQKAVSDEDGFIYLPRTAFTQGEKVKLKILPETPDKLPVAKRPKQTPPTPMPPAPMTPDMPAPPVAPPPPLPPKEELPVTQPENKDAATPTPPPLK